MNPETNTVPEEATKLFTVEKFVQLDDWLAARRSYGIGASEASIITGEYGSQLELYCNKLGIGEADDLSAIEAVEWGLLLEPVVAEKYARVTGRTLIDPGRLTICRSTVYPWAFASLDRAIEPIGESGEYGLLEIKTTGATHAEEWEYSCPRRPWIQVQHQLAVTGFRWGSVCVLIGGQKFRWMDLPRDESFIAELMEAERKFWLRVQAQDPPPPDSSEESKKAIKRLYPKEEGDPIALSGEAIKWDEELLVLDGKIGALKSRERLLENQLKSAIGPAPAGVLPNGVVYTFKTQNRAGYPIAPTSFRVLRRQAGK